MNEECDKCKNIFNTETDDYNIKVIKGKDIFICSNCQ